MRPYFIGLMSGTSLDGVDGVLVNFSASGTLPMQVMAHAHQAFTPALAGELLALNRPGDNELHRAALAGNALAETCAQVVESLLHQAHLTQSEVQAIGCHGQTVRHRPGEFDGTGYTLQLNQPALLAERCGIDVAADFRSRDVAAGGQGAPLVPAFHRAVFGRQGETVAVINLGGISNLTVIDSAGNTLGFDCGPGNALMDHWCQQHTGKAFDAEGQWAASGQPVPELLTSLRATDYFYRPPPKSTGRDLFNAEWLNDNLQQHSALLASRPPADIQATLAELTAGCCADAVAQWAPQARHILVCGGGAFNTHLIDRLSSLSDRPVHPTDIAGLPAMQVEAAAFAWLARALCLRQTGNLASVTGAAGDRILGALYPAA
jgi:anhydro-N-acetylmuramic acid kinase